MKRILKALALNALQLALCYLWLFQGQEWAGNLAKIMAALVLIAGLTICGSKELREKAKKAGCSLPRELSITLDLGMVGMFGACGHFWMAAIYLFSISAESYAYDADEN
jgi:hypothetical protein